MPESKTKWHRYGWIPGIGLTLLGNLWILAFAYHSPLPEIGLLIVFIGVAVFWVWLYDPSR